jgi:hypothetical protein
MLSAGYRSIVVQTHYQTFMLLQRGKYSLGRKLLRLMEVHLFFVISTMSGVAVVKDDMSVKSKSKDKTLRTTIGCLYQTSAGSAPPNDTNEPRHGEINKNSARSSCAVEKGKRSSGEAHRVAVRKTGGEKMSPPYAVSITSSPSLFQTPESVSQPAVHHQFFLPRNLLSITTPLLI